MSLFKLGILLCFASFCFRAHTQELDSISDLPDSLVELRMELLSKYISTHHDTSAVMEARSLLAGAYISMGFSDRALAELNLVYAYRQNQNDSLGMTEALYKISGAYSSIQDYSTSLEYVERARRTAPSPELLMDIYHRLGYLYFNLSALDSARTYLNKSIELHQDYGKKAISSMLMLTALSLKENDLDRTLNEFLMIERQGIEEASGSLQYLTYRIVGALYKRRGAWAIGQQYDRKAEAVAANVPFQQGLDFLETVVVADTIANNYKAATKSQQKYIERLQDSYRNNLTTQLANYEKLFQLKEKENEIELLEKENQVYELKEKESRSFVIILFLGMVALLLLLLLAYRILVIRTRTNKKLKLLNKQISTHRETLRDKNSQLERTIQELKGTQSQLIQSEKMASIGTFVSGVAHELNNPINILNGGLQVIERNLKEMEPDHDKRHRELIEDINIMLKESSFSITKINRIIQALVIATYTDQTPVEVDFSEIIDNVKLAFRSSVFPDIKFVQEVESVKLLCFPNRIHHAVKAILENAFYYAGLSESPEKVVKIIVGEESGQLVVAVENNGPVIPEGDLMKIFDPFFTTKDDGESPGLGLYFAFSAVKEHNGHISVENADGWVVLTVRFPLTHR